MPARHSIELNCANASSRLQRGRLTYCAACRCRHILSDPTFQEKFLTPNFFEPIVGSADAFASYVKAEQARWSKNLADNKLSAE
jgi:hypothetical protein